MRLLLRFGLFFALAGFVLGLLLRRAWPGRLPEVILLSALPWLAHLVYVLVWVFTTYDVVLSGVLFGLLDVGLVALTLRAGPRLYRPDTRRAALVPLLVLAVHLLLLGAWDALKRRVVSDAAEPVLRRGDAAGFSGGVQLRVADAPESHQTAVAAGNLPRARVGRLYLL